MLEKFRKSKQPEVDMLRKCEAEGTLPAPYEGQRISFADAVKRDESGMKVIAEYKRASPAKGDINLGLSAADVAGMYARGGASAISVLTEHKYFKGDLSYLEEIKSCGLPMLRKDFLVDPLQVVQTLSTPASALLVIVRMFADDDKLKEMIDKANECGLDAVVEAFDMTDLIRAKKAGAEIIQINNRDLDTLGVDMSRSVEFIREKAEGEIWICASGIAEPEDCAQMARLGYDCVLVGTSIMSSPDPQSKLAALVAGASS
ncbi:indole-3-glycerol phosphate synthase TrpC [Maridesulfovibrio hydrothermalis]|uniref:indole-3-glycerol-phosphate synthase n=1 Tax=Maridesulfovibrio hydrothermalis AM13 = DSM 14728 TaxID=1121451 RepID=L0RAN2_9BACT|nr:indole-3-glycerol-phosphate synthase [Maridesulfovibrio hydrothermalis]CCO23833.1 Indole-3-glycerol-phosphate synthase [Maridesulfovibrio hydrothermalis AM13 = DSM 14728]